MWLQGSWRSIWGQVVRPSHVSMEADPGETATSLPVKPHRSFGTHWNVSLHGYNLTARKSAKAKMCRSRFCLTFGKTCDVSNLKDELSDIRLSTKTLWRFQRLVTSSVQRPSPQCWRRAWTGAVAVSSISTLPLSWKVREQLTEKWSC